MSPDASPAGATTVAVIGPGRMGLAVIERLLAAGWPVLAHGRSDTSMQVAADLGARPATLEEAAQADTVIIVVYSDAQARAVGLRLASLMRAGATLVNHTTGSPETIRAIAQVAGPRGVQVLDAALSGGPDAIRAGHLTLLIGGHERILDDVRPLLSSYADPILHVGDLGAGQLTKLLNNALFGANVGLAAEVERIATSLGLDAAATLAAIQHCSGATGVIGMTQRAGSVASFQQGAREFIVKDVAVVASTADDLGIDLGFLGTAARFGADGPDQSAS